MFYVCRNPSECKYFIWFLCKGEENKIRFKAEKFKQPYQEANSNPQKLSGGSVLFIKGEILYAVTNLFFLLNIFNIPFANQAMANVNQDRGE